MDKSALQAARKSEYDILQDACALPFYVLFAKFEFLLVTLKWFGMALWAADARQLALATGERVFARTIRNF
jgi:hypothetical protein